MTATLFDPGWLRHFVTIERDGDAVASVWAQIEPRETEDGRKYTVTIRHRHDDFVGTNVLYRGRTFAVKDVRDPDGAERYLVLDASEVITESGRLSLDSTSRGPTPRFPQQEADEPAQRGGYSEPR